MQRIERYGVIALVFLIVTILAVSLWGESSLSWSALFGAKPEELAAVDKRAPASQSRPSRAVQDARAERKEALPLTAPGRVRPEREARLSSGPATLDSRPQDRAQPSSPASVADSILPQPDAAELRPRQRPRAAAPVASDDAAQAGDTERAVVRGAQTPRRQPTREVTVNPGETLGEIALRELGTSKRWREIQDLNGGIDPTRVRAGMKLMLPLGPVGEEAPAIARSSTPRAAQSEKSRPQAEPEPERARSGGGSYTVRAGDSLSEIAQRELGSARRWREILSVNPGLVPERLAVGEKLILPGERVASAVETPRASAAPESPARATRVNGHGTSKKAKVR